MKSDRIQDTLGMVRDDYILDAHEERKTNNRAWRRWGALAACLCLVAVCAVGVPKLLNREMPAPELPDMTGLEPEGPAPGPGDMVGPNWPFNEADPVGPHGDWPVIYNEVDSLPDACCYFPLAGRLLTDAERDALVPLSESDLSWLTPTDGTANFDGVMYEDGRLQEDARLDSVELWLYAPSSDCSFRIGMWPAGQTSVYGWASQFDPMDYEATHIGGDDEETSVTLFRCGDYSWTYFTCGDVSYFVYAAEGIYGVVNAIFRSDKTPDLSIIVPNP